MRRINQAAKGGLTPVDARSMETTFRYRYTWVLCALTVALDSLGVVIVVPGQFDREGLAMRC